MTNSNLISEAACELAINGIIKSEVKPLKKKPCNDAVSIMKIDNARAALNMNKLLCADDTSHLEELFKELK